MSENKRRLKYCLSLLPALLVVFYFSNGATAATLSVPPQSGAMGLVATIPSPPPSQGASISVPANGSSFTSLPITVSGLCPSGLLIKVFSNNIFIGSALCSGGSYSLKVDLFNGANILYVQDFDALGQGGPLSSQVNVSYSGGSFAGPVNRITMTSAYAEKGASPGSLLTWPIAISGGVPPYAISTDWGDGQPPTLQPVSLASTFNIDHTYQTSGHYTVTVSATDAQGNTAFLQLVGIADGQIVPTSNTANAQKGANVKTSDVLPWWFFLILLAVMGPAFWLGVRHGKAVLIKKFQAPER